MFNKTDGKKIKIIGVCVVVCHIIVGNEMHERYQTRMIIIKNYNTSVSRVY